MLFASCPNEINAKAPFIFSRVRENSVCTILFLDFNILNTDRLDGDEIAEACDFNLLSFA